MPRANIEAIQESLPDQFCPRVELLRSNRVVAELSLAAARWGAGHALWGRLFDLHAATLQPSRRVVLLYRVMNALAEPGVAARIKRAQDKAAEAAAPKKRTPRRRR